MCSLKFFGFFFEGILKKNTRVILWPNVEKRALSGSEKRNLKKEKEAKDAAFVQQMPSNIFDQKTGGR